MAVIKEIKDCDFSAAIAGGMVLVDFWASWCNPCKILSGILEQVAADLPEDITIAKINVDDCQMLAAEKGVSTLPTLILYKDGVKIKEMVGVQSRAKLVELLSNA